MNGQVSPLDILRQLTMKTCHCHAVHKNTAAQLFFCSKQYLLLLSLLFEGFEGNVANLCCI
jgi:hypothetical protein